MKANLVFFLLLSSSLVFTGCKDDDNGIIPVTPPANTSRIRIALDHQVNNQPLVINSSALYTSPGGQEYRVSDFRYYFSNVKFLSNSSGHVFEEQESYHFIHQGQPSTLTFDLDKVAPGTYDSLFFAIGVDNNRNHTGAQTGALDPNNGMLWSWITGYKFFQLEGRSASAPAPTNTFLYHIGHDQNYRVVKLGLSPAITVSADSKHTIRLKADVNRVLGTPDSPVLFDQVHTVMGIPNSDLIADNYVQMFSVLGISAE